MKNWNQVLKSRTKWDKRFMQIAYCVRGWSKDTKSVGAVLVNPDRRIISTGYNGFPANIKDTIARMNNKEEKRSLMIHAEVNALLNAVSDTRDSTLYVTRFPCHECMKPVIQKGITRLVCPLPETSHEIWGPSQKLAWDLLTEAGIEHTEQA